MWILRVALTTGMLLGLVLVVRVCAALIVELLREEVDQ